MWTICGESAYIFSLGCDSDCASDCASWVSFNVILFDEASPYFLYFFFSDNLEFNWHDLIIWNCLQVLNFYFTIWSRNSWCVEFFEEDCISVLFCTSRSCPHLENFISQSTSAMAWLFFWNSALFSYCSGLNPIRHNFFLLSRNLPSKYCMHTAWCTKFHNYDAWCIVLSHNDIDALLSQYWATEPYSSLSHSIELYIIDDWCTV